MKTLLKNITQKNNKFLFLETPQNTETAESISNDFHKLLDGLTHEIVPNDQVIENNEAGEKISEARLSNELNIMEYEFDDSFVSSEQTKITFKKFILDKAKILNISVLPENFLQNIASDYVPGFSKKGFKIPFAVDTSKQNSLEDHKNLKINLFKALKDVKSEDRYAND